MAAKIVNLRTRQFRKAINGSLALKPVNIAKQESNVFVLEPVGINENNMEYSKPKILVLKPVSSNKLFSQCWQVASDEDAC